MSTTHTHHVDLCILVLAYFPLLLYFPKSQSHSTYVDFAVILKLLEIDPIIQTKGDFFARHTYL